MSKKNIMKQFIILLIVFSSLSAQGKKKTSSKNNHFSIGVNFSPDYCYRTLTKNNKSLSHDQWTNAKRIQDSIDRPKFGYTIGINLRLQLHKKVSIETGFQYSEKGYKTIPISTFYDPNPPFSIVIATNNINYDYFDLPLKVNFSFLEKRIQIATSAGLIFNVLRQVSVKINPEPPSTFKTKTIIDHYDYNKLNISALASVGLKFKLNKRMDLQLEPNFRYGLLNTDSKSFQTNHLWSAGLNLGYYIGL